MPDPTSFLASNLIPGRVYRVKTAFTDFDGHLHPVGETWRFVLKHFQPHDDGLALIIEQASGQSTVRLEWLPQTQAGLIEHFSDFVELLPETGASLPSGRAAKSQKKVSLWVKLLAGLGILVGLLVCLAVGAFIAFEYAISYRPPASDQYKKGLEYNSTSQVYVRLNQDFDLELYFTNYDPQPRRLDRIGLPASYLAGVTVRQSSPAFTNFTSLPGDPAFVYYSYQTEIPAHGKLDLLIHLNAVKTGDYNGQIKVCIDSPTNCTLEYVRSLIQ